MPQTRSSSSIPYTAAPITLILSDLSLWFRITFVLPPAGLTSIIFPIGPFNSGPLDELYPSVGNIWALLAQLVLIVIQSAFLLSLIPCAFGIAPPWISGYTPAWLVYVVGFVLATRWICTIILNGRSSREYIGSKGVTEDDKKKFANEKWVFVNGVAAGQHWMQSNIDRLALTFKREIFGIHNETRGIAFDLVEVILERTLGWATPSTRKVYAKLLDIISDDAYERIILILHSQGAVEGGLALDWLFATVPASLLGRVEVYTFGSATNHFNNPSFQVLDDAGNPMQTDPDQDGRILKHVEHYANEGDYVSQFGILNFRPRPGTQKRRFDWTAVEEASNMYYGRLFIRKGFGHQFNSNYLDNLFMLDAEQAKVADSNPFMNAVFDEALLEAADIVAVKDKSNPASSTIQTITSQSKSQSQTQTQPLRIQKSRRISESVRRIKDVSRLWEYRNGGIPDDTDDNSYSGNTSQNEYDETMPNHNNEQVAIKQRRLAKGYESDVDEENDNNDQDCCASNGSAKLKIKPLQQLND